MTRERGQTIVIGDGIEVTVVDIRGSWIRLGITAPRDVTVHRYEVAQAIRRERRAKEIVAASRDKEQPMARKTKITDADSDMSLKQLQAELVEAEWKQQKAEDEADHWRALISKRKSAAALDAVDAGATPAQVVEMLLAK